MHPHLRSFLRCALIAHLPIYLIYLHFLRCYALSCIYIWGLCKGLKLHFKIGIRCRLKTDSDGLLFYCIPVFLLRHLYAGYP